jgi:integrase
MPSVFLHDDPSGKGGATSRRATRSSRVKLSDPDPPRARCGLTERPNLTFHSLRHTFASAMIKATKGDAEKVRRWTCHADIKVLLERYSHEFESARGGRRIEEDIAEMDAAYGA